MEWEVNVSRSLDRLWGQHVNVLSQIRWQTFCERAKPDKRRCKNSNQNKQMQILCRRCWHEVNLYLFYCGCHYQSDARCIYWIYCVYRRYLHNHPRSGMLQATCVTGDLKWKQMARCCQLKTHSHGAFSLHVFVEYRFLRRWRGYGENAGITWIHMRHFVYVTLRATDRVVTWDLFLHSTRSLGMSSILHSKFSIQRKQTARWNSWWNSCPKKNAKQNDTKMQNKCKDKCQQKSSLKSWKFKKPRVFFAFFYISVSVCFAFFGHFLGMSSTMNSTMNSCMSWIGVSTRFSFHPQFRFLGKGQAVGGCHRLALQIPDSFWNWFRKNRPKRMQNKCKTRMQTKRKNKYFEISSVWLVKGHITFCVILFGRLDIANMSNKWIERRVFVFWLFESKARRTRAFGVRWSSEISSHSSERRWHGETQWQRMCCTD